MQTAAAIAALMILGTLLGWHTLRQTEKNMQESLMNRTQMAKDALTALNIAALSSSDTAEEAAIGLQVRALLNVLASAEGDFRLACLIIHKPGGECILIHSNISDDFGENAVPVQKISDFGDLCRMLHMGNESIEEISDNQGNIHVIAVVPIHDPHSGKVIAAVGIGENKNNWKPVMIRAALPAGTLSLAFIVIVWTAAIKSTKQPRQDRKQEQQTGWMKPVSAAFAGLALTCYTAWVVHQNDIHIRSTAFEKLAASQSYEIIDRFYSLHYIELEGLARFIENTEEITDSCFQRYSTFLTRNPAVQAWEWIPAVSADDRKYFEESMREEGLTLFDIWEKNPHGNRIPASKRVMYYPVSRIAPMADNEKALGYDLGSEPIRRAALEEAARTGLATATNPITLVQETGSQKGMLIYRPIFNREQPSRLRGFSLAVLRMGTLLNSVIRDKSILLGLSVVHGVGMEESMASDWKPAGHPPIGRPSLTRFIPAFGKILSLTAYPDNDFYQQHPIRAGLSAALVGLILTAALTGGVSLVVRRREELERLIALRTAELQESEANFRSFFETIPDPILVGTWDGRILFVNKAAALKLEYTAESLSSMYLLDLYSTDRHGDATVLFTAILQGKQENVSLIMRTKAGIPIPVETRIWSGKWSGTNCIFFFSKDLSAEQETQQRMEEKIARTNERMRMATDSAGIGIWDMNFSQNQLIWDDWMFRLYGVNPADFSGDFEFWRKCVHPDDLDSATDLVVQALHAGSNFDTEFRIVHPDGDIRYLKAHAMVTRDDHGEPLRMTGINYDITERRLAQETLQQRESYLSAIIENQPGLVWLKDAESRFLAVNLAFARSCGKLDAEFLIGKTDFDIWPKDLAAKYREDDSSVMAGGKPIMVEEQILHKGESRWFETFKIPVLSGKNKVLGTTGYARDITDRKRAEERILESNRQLTEAMIRADRLARAAQAANVAKSDFLANMSHELRTPLNAILALSEALIEQVRGPLNERQMASLKNIETSGHHLLDLINDILDLAKVESGRLNIQRQWVLVSEVCEACLNLVQETAAAKGLTLNFRLDDPKIHINADPKRLRQMLTNLLSNAVKFTPTEGSVSLAVSLLADRHAVDFTVQDSGIGIAAEDMDRLFKPFTQLDSSLSRRHEGSGLGLVLVQRLVEMHDGSITVESEPGKGSCFTLVLPIGNPATDGKSPEKGDGAGGSNRSLEIISEPRQLDTSIGQPVSTDVKILYVDDNESNITAVGEYLQDVGFQVSIAQNGLEALKMAEYVRPDIFLMDIQMPKMDGLEATRRLRLIPAYANTPIIVLTALAMPGDRERSLEAGADEYLTKPVYLKELIATIHRLISKGKQSNGTTKQYDSDRG